MANEVIKKVSFTRSLTKTLMKHFKDNMPSIEKAYDEFPNQQQKLVMPSFSVTIQTPKLEPRTPSTISIGTKITEGENANKALIRRVIGVYDFSLQLDFWCESKVQRHDIYEEFINALNNNQSTAGMILTLEDYYGEKMTIDAVDPSFVDDNEESAQRGEWRFKVNVFGNSRCIQEKLEYIISKVEVDLQTT